MNDPSIEERLAALQARRPESAVAEPTADLLPPTGAPVELPAPMMAAHTDVAVDPVDPGQERIASVVDGRTRPAVPVSA